MNSKLFLAIILFNASSIANSSNLSGIIDALKFGPINGARIYIRMQETITNKPICSENQYYDFVLDASQIGGREIYSGLLSAFHAQKTISIEGMNACNFVSDIEDLKQVVIQK